MVAADNMVVVVTAIMAGIAFVGLIFLAVSALGPTESRPHKRETYECGSEPIGSVWIPFRIQYYVFALLFVIFDIETAFFYPWALVNRTLGWRGFLEVAIFVVVLFVGLAYAWRKRAFRWE